VNGQPACFDSKALILAEPEMPLWSLDFLADNDHLIDLTRSLPRW